MRGYTCKITEPTEMGIQGCGYPRVVMGPPELLLVTNRSTVRTFRSSTFWCSRFHLYSVGFTRPIFSGVQGTFCILHQIPSKFQPLISKIRLTSFRVTGLRRGGLYSQENTLTSKTGHLATIHFSCPLTLSPTTSFAPSTTLAQSVKRNNRSPNHSLGFLRQEERGS